MSNDDIVEWSQPPEYLYTAIGMIGYVWAELDMYVSALSCKYIGIDPIEYTISFGKEEITKKIDKLKKIAIHRNDEGAIKCLSKSYSTLSNCKSFRNIVTHGRYYGKSSRNEFIYFIFTDAILHEDGSYLKMEAFSDNEILIHVKDVQGVITDLINCFRHLNVSALYALPARVPKRS